MNETMEKVKQVEACVKRITRLWKNYRKRDDEIRHEVRCLLDSIGPEFSVVDLILNEDEGPLFIEGGEDRPMIPEDFIQMLEHYAERNKEGVVQPEFYVRLLEHYAQRNKEDVTDGQA